VENRSNTNPSFKEELVPLRILVGIGKERDGREKAGKGVRSQLRKIVRYLQ